MVQIIKRHLRVVIALAALILSAVFAAQAQIQRAQKVPVPLPPPRQSTVPQVPLPQPPAPTPQDQPAQAPLPPAPAAQAPLKQAPLNMLATAPEQIGEVPNHFFWIRQGLQAVRDPVDGQLVFIDDVGHVTGRAALPAGFDIGEVFAEADRVRLIDTPDRSQVTIARTVDPAAATPLQTTAVMANGGARALRLRRRGPQHLVYHDERRTGSRALNVRAVAGGTLAQAYEIGSGQGDSRYLVSEEIVGTKPSLQVRVFAHRFDRAGRLTGVAFVPLDGMDVVPRDFIAVSGEGGLRVLTPTPTGVKIVELAFSLPPPAGRAGDDDIKNLGRVLREIAVETKVISYPVVRFRGEGPRLELTVPTPPITRAKMIENARAYLTVNWVMQPESYEKPGIENACEPERYKLWLRPRHFTRDLIGTTIGPMPYRWGGGDTPETFRLRTEWGALAGDLCTCRVLEFNYCVFPEAAGVDCSGFVSRAWGIEKRGTSGLLDVADDVDSIQALKPGDAFDWPQRHVRLFTGMAPGAAIGFTVLESTTRLECEGVCERTYRPSELDGYRLIRYRGITDEEVVVSDAAPGGAVPTDTAPTGTAPAATSQNGTAPTTIQNGTGQTGAGQNSVARNSTAKNGTGKNGTVKSATAARRR